MADESLCHPHTGAVSAPHVKWYKIILNKRAYSGQASNKSVNVSYMSREAISYLSSDICKCLFKVDRIAI